MKTSLSIEDPALLPLSNSWIENGKLRYFLFSLMCLGYVCNGINLSLIGPSIDELASIYGASLESVSIGFTVKAISNCLCSIVAGFTMVRFSRHLQYSIALAMYGLTSCLLPQLPSLYWFWSAWAVYGGASAFIDIAINVWVLELFEMHNVNLHVQFIHLSFSFGQIFGPLMVQPYLVQESSLEDQITIAQKSQLIRIPYLAAGGCFIFVAVCIFVCYLVNPYIPPNRKVFGPKRRQLSENENRSRSASTCSKRDQYKTTTIVHQSIPNSISDQKQAHSNCPLWFRSLFLVLLLLLFCIEVSSEYILMMYLPPYFARSQLQVPKSMAAQLASTFGQAYTLGRAGSLLLALTPRVPVTAVFYTQMAAAFTACGLFRFAGQLDLVANGQTSSFWWTRISVWLIGLGFSSAFPNMMVFLEQRINITDRLNCAMLALSTVLFSLCSPIFARVLDTRPNTFIEITAGIVASLFTCFAILHSTDLLRSRINRKLEQKLNKKNQA